MPAGNSAAYALPAMLSRGIFIAKTRRRSDAMEEIKPYKQSSAIEKQPEYDLGKKTWFLFSFASLRLRVFAISPSPSVWHE